jgi:hypothetical protein
MSRDLGEIQTEYITTNQSLRVLAAKYGVFRTTLDRHCAKEGWTDKRKKYREDVAMETLNKVTHGTAGLRANHLTAIAESATCMAEGIRDALRDIDFNYRVSSNEAKQFPHTINAKDIRDLTAALKDLLNVARDAYDLPNGMEQKAHLLAEERLKLDRQKAKAADNDGTKLVVSFDQAEAEGYAK